TPTSVVLFVLFFFFSSRRRHTRCLSDWSSDVCSSDLSVGREKREHPIGGEMSAETLHVVPRHRERRRPAGIPAERSAAERETERSEERRVGKACRRGGVADTGEEKSDMGVERPAGLGS